MVTGKALSPSSRRAWIEISSCRLEPLRSGVALLAEGVDRNWVSLYQNFGMATVALLAEGVDRNNVRKCRSDTVCKSPSSRRAWIEIGSRPGSRRWGQVALLAEGVDRNFISCAMVVSGKTSPSSRRAWIEIGRYHISRPGRPVALLAEGVDRNQKSLARATEGCGRPPRGGRG